MSHQKLKIRYGNASMLVEGPEYQDFADKFAPFDEMVPLAWPRNVSRGICTHPVAPESNVKPDYRRKINTLSWPGTGASRWAEFWFYMTADQWAIVEDSDERDFLVVTDMASDTVMLDVPMYPLITRTRHKKTAARSLVLGCLVDARYFLQFVPITLAEVTLSTTWSTILTEINAAMESMVMMPVISEDTVADPAYLGPDPEYFNGRQAGPIATIIDALAISTGRRFVCQPTDNGWALQGPTEANIAQFDNQNVFDWQTTGFNGLVPRTGIFPDETEGDKPFNAPEKVVVSFPMATHGRVASPLKYNTIEVPTSLINYDDRKLIGTRKIIHSTAWSDQTTNGVGSAADNAAELQSLADKIASDYFDHFEMTQHDMTFSRILQSAVEGERYTVTAADYLLEYSLGATLDESEGGGGMRVTTRIQGEPANLRTDIQAQQNHNASCHTCDNTLTWDFSTITSDADPGDFKFQLNSGTPASATFLYINDEPHSDIDVGAVLDSLHAGDHVYIEDCDGNAMLFLVRTATTDGTGYWKIPVTHLSGTTLFDDLIRCEVKFLSKSCPESMSWDFSTTINDADPGDYKFRFNSGSTSGTTFLYINDENLGVLDCSSIIDDLHFGDHVHLSNCDGVSVLFLVRGATTDGTGYWKVPVTHVSGSVLFANDEMVAFKFIPKSCPNTLTWDFSTTINDADPGDYKFRFNSGSTSGTTFLYINDNPNSDIDVGTMLGDLAIGTRIYIEDCDGVAVMFKVAGAPTDGTGYWKIPVTHVSGTTLFANEASCEFKFIGGANTWNFYDSTISKTLAAWDSATFVPPGTGNLTATLPALADVSPGDMVRIGLENTNSNLITQSGVIIDPNGAEKLYGKFRTSVDEFANAYLYFDHEYIILMADPAQSRWEIVGSGHTGQPAGALVRDSDQTGITSTTYVPIEASSVLRLSHGGRLHKFQGTPDFCMQTMYDSIVDIHARVDVELTAGATPPYLVEVVLEARIGAGGAWNQATRTQTSQSFSAVGERHALPLVGRFQTNVESGIRMAIRVASGATVKVNGGSNLPPYMIVRGDEGKDIGLPVLT